VLRAIDATTREHVTRDLVRPAVVIFRASVDPVEAVEAVSELETEFFHPDTGDDTLFQAIVDRESDICGAVTLYVIPESYLAQLFAKFTQRNLTLISGAPMALRDGKLVRYDPAPLVWQRHKLAVEKRVYSIAAA